MKGVIHVYESNEVMFVCCLTSKRQKKWYLGVKLGFTYGFTTSKICHLIIPFT